MKRYIKDESALHLIDLDGQYRTDQSDMSFITFLSTTLNSPYIVPCDDDRVSKPLMSSNDDFE